MTRIILHTLWCVRPEGAELTEAAMERLVTYITRYAQTLQMTVLAVGGVGDHVHILHDLQPDRVLERDLEELRRTTQRFIRDSCAIPGFNWSEEIWIQSVSASDTGTLIGYVRENAARHRADRLLPEWECQQEEPEGDPEEMPEWLRRAANSG